MTLEQALTYAQGELQQHDQVALQINDSGVYTAPSLAVDLPAGTTLEFRAAEAHRPTLILSGELTPTGAASSSFELNGIVISSAAVPATPSPIALLHVPADRPDGSPNELGQLLLTDCTLVPGWALTAQGDPQFGHAAALVAEPSGLQLNASRSIVGGIRCPELATVTLTDSILDATSPSHVAYAALDGAGAGGALTLQGCTVIGKVHATLLTLVSNSIVWAALAIPDSFKAPLWSDRVQAGCIRFSYLPPGAITPRQYECFEQGPQTPQPLFFSLRYGDASYAKLLASTDNAIRRGADDGGEMGVFHFLLAPLRESDLRIRLQEYLPVGLEAGIIYQN